jgi:hypothetical protein
MIQDMNRKHRRQAYREARINWHEEKAREKAQARVEAAALRLSPAAARRLLAEWAAKPGHSESEVDRLNGVADVGQHS